MTTKRDLLLGGASAAAAAFLLPLATSAAHAATGRPGFFSAKDIAEAAYIYGLPIVMNYGIMYEFIIDKTSSQYKAPFNTIANEARVFTYKDTAVVTPNSDTPYSMLWLDLRAEPMVISVPAVDPKRYYSVQLPTATPITTAISAAALPAAKRATTWWWGRAGPAAGRKASARCSRRRPSSA